MHPLVRDLYKRVIHVGRDYPTGLAHVRATWKQALGNPNNCPSCYEDPIKKEACHEELLRAVYRGRHMVKEMIGVVQLKKYRAMKQRYPSHDNTGANHDPVLKRAMETVEANARVR
jgi:hypothetical protein